MNLYKYEDVLFRCMHTLYMVSVVLHLSSMCYAIVCVCVRGGGCGWDACVVFGTYPSRLVDHVTHAEYMACTYYTHRTYFA